MKVISTRPLKSMVTLSVCAPGAGWAPHVTPTPETATPSAITYTAVMGPNHVTATSAMKTRIVSRASASTTTGSAHVSQITRASTASTTLDTVTQSATPQTEDLSRTIQGRTTRTIALDHLPANVTGAPNMQDETMRDFAYAKSTTTEKIVLTIPDHVRTYV
jgi:hypothetical protein